MVVQFRMGHVLFTVSCSDDGLRIYSIEAVNEYTRKKCDANVYDEDFIRESDEFWDSVESANRNDNELLFDDF